METAVYARVSDDKLKEDGQRRQDVQRQIERLLPYAGKDALLFIDDGKSAFKEDYNARPEFLHLLREIRGNRIKHVYVESLDRWSRRIVEGLTTLREASEHGCTVSSLAEGECNITFSQGWFKVGVAFLLSEWASRDKSDKVKSGMARAREKKENLCESCGVIHIGRHPLDCNCKRCSKKRVGQAHREEEKKKEGAMLG